MSYELFELFVTETNTGICQQWDRVTLILILILMSVSYMYKRSGVSGVSAGSYEYVYGV